jgi:hypothetical protein
MKYDCGTGVGKASLQNDIANGLLLPEPGSWFVYSAGARYERLPALDTFAIIATYYTW